MKQKSLKQLEKYQNFIFENYSFDRETGVLKLNYSLDETVFFEEEVGFRTDGIEWENVNLIALENAFRAFHLMAGISYYKAYCPRGILIKNATLSEEEAVFWNNLYKKGLGEFFYQNQIDFEKLINFPFGEASLNGFSRLEVVKVDLKDRALLPIGGGKDSLVSADLLLEAGIDFNLFSLRDSDPIRETSELIGVDRIIIDRKISAKLLELNSQDALNGHVPITAYISFLTAICALLYNYKNIVFSLEKSANFGQIFYGGIDINHQYSKSEEFEADFNQYLNKFVFQGLNYFSLLRGMYEVKIAEIFSLSPNLERYLPIFTSCNRNFKLSGEKMAKKWCGECPKCVFVWVILSAFIEKDKLIEVFGQNLYDKSELGDLFAELLGIRNIKPFECVGTAEEVIWSMIQAFQSKQYQNDYIMREFEQEFLINRNFMDIESEMAANVLKIDANDKMMFIPEKFQNILNKYR